MQLKGSGIKKVLILFIMLLGMSFSSTQAKDMDFIDFSGKATKLSDYKGNWVIVNLWASWCPPCITEMPELVMFHDKYAGRGAMVLGVNYENSPLDKVKTFADDLLINFPLVRFKNMDLNSNRTEFGPLRGLPSTYIVSPEGEVVAARTGMVNLEMLEEFIENYEKENNL